MNRSYPTSGYDVPKKNVLLISCIDLRLTDDLVRFMEHENLTNRYDHFILAGASLGITLESRSDWRNDDVDDHDCEHDCGKYGVIKNGIDFAAWHQTLNNHLTIAQALHKIEDVYIVEHENCGAYKAFVKDEVLHNLGEEGCQRASAHLLADLIESGRTVKTCKKDEPKPLKVHCFLMDLRGNVKLLER